MDGGLHTACGCYSQDGKTNCNRELQCIFSAPHVPHMTNFPYVLPAC